MQRGVVLARGAHGQACTMYSSTEALCHSARLSVCAAGEGDSPLKVLQRRTVDNASTADGDEHDDDGRGKCFLSLSLFASVWLSLSI